MYRRLSSLSSSLLFASSAFCFSAFRAFMASQYASSLMYPRSYVMASTGYLQHTQEIKSRATAAAAEGGGQKEVRIIHRSRMHLLRRDPVLLLICRPALDRHAAS